MKNKKVYTNKLLRRIAHIINCNNKYQITPLQGSGTYALESMFLNLISPKDKILILSNGTYGDLAYKICIAYKINCCKIDISINGDIIIADIEKALIKDRDITHLFITHCETSTGIVNPMLSISKIAHKYNKKLLVDSVSSFGVLPVDVTKYDATILSSGKYIGKESGIFFIAYKKNLISYMKNNPRPRFVLDILAQHTFLKKFNTWRFTPPNQTIKNTYKAIVNHNQNYLSTVCKLRLLGLRPYFLKRTLSLVLIPFKNFNYSYLENSNGYITKLKIKNKYYPRISWRLFQKDWKYITLILDNSFKITKV